MCKTQSEDITPRMTALLLAIVTVVYALVMQYCQEYRFYAKEAEYLWLNDSLWVGQWLTRPAGIAQLLTSALTQFFGIWGVGPWTMALLFAMLMVCGLSLHRQLCLPSRLRLWWLIPVSFLYLCHENGYYNLRGTVATVMAVGAACVYVRHRSVLSAALLTGLVCWMAGAAGVLLAVLIVVIELITSRRWWRMDVAMLTAVLAAGIGVQQGVWIGMEEALTPAQYYNWPSTYFIPLYAWLSIIVLPLAGRLRRWVPALQWVGVAVPVVLMTVLYGSVHNPKAYLLRADEWRANHQDWDGIIEAHRGQSQPTPFMSYLNLALAQRGQLVARMGEFNPYIAWSDEAQMYSPVLMTQNELSRDALKLQSCLCMAWGGAALCNAQKAAYEANFLTPGDTDPIELQRLVLTNQLFETPATAQKYLRRLSRTTMHHAWADERLARPELLQADVDRLGKTLPDEDSFYMKTQVVRVLRQEAMRNPDNRVAAQFYEAYLIQSRDSVAFRHWREFLNQQGTNVVNP